jgi:hypothetical protein
VQHGERWRCIAFFYLGNQVLRTLRLASKLQQRQPGSQTGMAQPAAKQCLKGGRWISMLRRGRGGCE